MPRPRLRPLAVMLALCLLLPTLPACDDHRPATEAARTARPDAPAAAWTRTTFYLGLARKNAPVIGEDEWNAFLEAEVTPRFPDGLTVVDARGQWRSADGHILREPSKMLIILHQATDETRASVASIAAAYKNRFAQESVLIEEAAVHVRFE